MIHIFFYGGLPMWILLIFFIYGIIIILDRINTLGKKMEMLPQQKEYLAKKYSSAKNYQLQFDAEIANQKKALSNKMYLLKLLAFIAPMFAIILALGEISIQLINIKTAQAQITTNDFYTMAIRLLLPVHFGIVISAILGGCYLILTNKIKDYLTSLILVNIEKQKR